MNETTPKTPLLSDKMYVILKFVAMILLPAVGSAYFALAQIWHLPKANEVNGTILVIDTLLGGILGLSTSQYNRSGVKYDGNLVVEEPASGKQVYSLVIHSDVNKINEQKELVLKVVPQQ